MLRLPVGDFVVSTAQYGKEKGLSAPGQPEYLDSRFSIDHTARNLYPRLLQFHPRRMVHVHDIASSPTPRLSSCTRTNPARAATILYIQSTWALYLHIAHTRNI